MMATPANPPLTNAPTRHESACQLATTTSAAVIEPMAAIRIQSISRDHRVPVSRSNSSGLTCRTSSNGTSAKSSETRTPIPAPCAAADRVRPKEISPYPATTFAGTACNASAAIATPSRLPPNPSTRTWRT